MTTSTGQMITDVIVYGRELLYREELRVLRNLSWLPSISRKHILDSLKLSASEKKFILTWLGVTVDPFQDFWKYHQWLNLGYCVYLDAYIICYDDNYNLTTLGQEMHDAAATLVTNNG